MQKFVLPVVEKRNLPGVRCFEDIVNSNNRPYIKKWLINSFIMIIDCVEENLDILPNKDYIRVRLYKEIPRLRRLATAGRSDKIIEILEELPENRLP
jgi:hypothetical protein